jgi:hypothetical protein
MPAPIDLDFAGQAKRAKPVGLVLLAAGVLALGLAGWALAPLLREAQTVRETVVDLSSRVAPAVARTQPDPREAGRMNASLQVARSLASPWAGLMNSLEHTPPNVALLSIEPSAQKRTVVITAQARDAKAMLTHLKALQQDGQLRSITLVSHQRDDQISGNPLRYRIQGEW